MTYKTIRQYIAIKATIHINNPEIIMLRSSNAVQRAIGLLGVDYHRSIDFHGVEPTFANVYGEFNVLENMRTKFFSNEFNDFRNKYNKKSGPLLAEVSHIEDELKLYYANKRPKQYLNFKKEYKLRWVKNRSIEDKEPSQKEGDEAM